MTRSIVIFMMSIVVLAFDSQIAEAAAICSGSSANLKCLERHFDEFYAQDYYRFAAILNKSADEAKQCRSIKKTAEFLSLAHIKTGNAEFNEFFADATEKLCVSSPHCFKRASRLLDKEAQMNLATMINNPLFIDRTDLRKADCIGK